ncbi:cadherin-8 isoform X2 [Protopterus annectens]|uniref:cadherin-8 isoform X2 n=1 Tax=Protopterus annectens TaxID=7888 RepID=UPI001CFB88CC|nr:cadherin-8 isoform X2 [Protopterus annectens]
MQHYELQDSRLESGTIIKLQYFYEILSSSGIMPANHKEMLVDIWTFLMLLRITVLPYVYMAPTTIPQSLQMELSKEQNASNEDQRILNRSKRGWVWNQMFVLEEFSGPEPILVGRLHIDRNVTNTRYILSGEGAGTTFVINDRTGDIHAMKRLDREEKAEYTLTAQAIDAITNRALEPPSEFIIKVQDINDNAPEFPGGPFQASVPEMSEVGTSVTVITATDADDPVYGNSAKLVYSILEGQPYFSIEPHTAIIRTALANMDREAREEYLVVIQAKDMGGHMGGLSGTTTVTITLTDVNDNPPKFAQSLYHFSTSEDSPIGEQIGRVKVYDRDIEDNAKSSYGIIEGDGMDVFQITSDPETQDGIITIKKPLNFETKKSYTLKVEAENVHIDPQFSNRGPFKDTATVKITVEDADEPPVFSASAYAMEVHENAAINSVIGQVTAQDPDSASSPLRFTIDRHTDLERQFNINTDDGKITLATALDRETNIWHNITVIATEIRNHSQVSRVPVAIRVLDVNDNAPEFASEYDAYLCEHGKPGQVIQTVSAIDKDDPKNGHYFFYSLLPQMANNPNFTLKKNEVIVVLFVTLRRHKNEPLIIKDDEDVRENIIRYDDEGGGEEDTEAFDIATLQNPDGVNGFLPRKDIKPDLQFMPRQGLTTAPNGVDVDEFINVRLHEADNDPTAPPYDSIQIYGYEGRGSVAGSLSSIESSTSDSDQNFDYLSEWGPRFKRLGELYSVGESDKET